MKIRQLTRLWGAAIALVVGGALVPQSSQAGDLPFMGEILWVSFDFAPRHWAKCDGQIMPINQNQALFSLLGTTYGGDGITNFALPNMRSRAPIHVSNNYPLGQVAGSETHTLVPAEIPQHTHGLTADAQEATAALASNTSYLAKTGSGTSAYGSTPGAAMAPQALAAAGGSQPHENMKPYIALNCIIALQGIFPSRN